MKCHPFNLQLSNLQLSNLQLSKLQLSKLQLSNLQLSNLQLSTLLPLAFASIITFSTNVALADAKNEVIDKQQEMTQTEMDAAKNASPVDEKRPAATTSQDKHSTESPKGDMIKKQKKATEQVIDAAKPKVDKKPAANSYHY